MPAAQNPRPTDYLVLRTAGDPIDSYLSLRKDIKVLGDDRDSTDCHCRQVGFDVLSAVRPNGRLTHGVRDLLARHAMSRVPA